MYTPYAPRPLEFLGLESVAGYRLKVYAIRYGEAGLDRERFDACWPMASAVLPQPDRAAGRPGAGFVILHQGATGDYVVLCWWDRENELPTRVFVRDAGGWRPAEDGESFCVWDLRVMWREREAYVASVLTGRDDGLEIYLTAFLEGTA